MVTAENIHPANPNILAKFRVVGGCGRGSVLVTKLEFQSTCETSIPMHVTSMWLTPKACCQHSANDTSFDAWHLMLPNLNFCALNLQSNCYTNLCPSAVNVRLGHTRFLFAKQIWMTVHSASGMRFKHARITSIFWGLFLVFAHFLCHIETCLCIQWMIVSFGLGNATFIVFFKAAFLSVGTSKLNDTSFGLSLHNLTLSYIP